MATGDMHGLERAARLALGNFEEPTAPEIKPPNLKPAPVLLVIACAMAMIVALIFLVR